jgi:transcriptional regulator with XRE-family HTH domain
MPRRASATIRKHIAGRLRMRRMMLGMSQAKLAKSLGVSFQQVQKYEKSASGISADTLYDLAKILRVPVAFFYESLPETDPADGLGEPPTPSFVHDVLGTREGATVLETFPHIESGWRRRLAANIIAALANRDLP